MKKAVFILLSVLCLSAFAGKAQTDYPFIHINTANSGISYDGISVIYQDSRGFIWIGTFKGLNRYDGCNFKVYYKEDLGISSDFIHVISEDRKGNLWIGTDRGLVIYDYNLDSFRPLSIPSDKGTVIRNKVNNIRCSDDGKVWVSVLHQGLFSYDTDNDELINYFVADDKMTLSQSIRRFVIDNNGTFWLDLYYTDFYRSDESLVTLKEVDLGSDTGFFKSDNIEGLVVSHTANNILYAVTVKNGLCEIDVKNKTVRRLMSLPVGTVPLEMCQDLDRCLWIATTRGLYRYDIKSGEHLLFKENKNDLFSISDDYVYSIYVDNSGGVWAGTKDGGLNYSSPSRATFRKYYKAGDVSLKNSIVSGFSLEGHDKIWITTEKSGVFTYSISDGMLYPYRKAVFKETLCAPCYDSGYLWMGTLTGLIKMDVKTGQVQRYNSFLNSASVEDSRCLVTHMTDAGDLFVGTTLGLMKYDRDEDEFLSVNGFEGKFITSIAEDSNGTLWISTYADGVFAYEPGSRESVIRQYSYPYHLSTNKISTMFVDSQDRIWAIGFSFGFFGFDKDSDTFIRYDRAVVENLPSDVFFCGLNDAKGNIWLASDNGLVRFDPGTSDASCFTMRDGLLNGTMGYSCLQIPSGELLFGSKDGFVRFQPSAMSVSSSVPNVVISDFRIGDRIILPSDGSVLSENVDMVDKIVLRSNQNSFGFTISNTSINTQADNAVQCYLEGFDRQPHTLKNDNSIFWYNVPPGTYTMHVRATNTPGIWNGSHKPLKIVVERPLWMSPIAVCAYVLLVFVILFVLMYTYRKKLRREEQFRHEQFEKAKEKEMIEEKMTFFANVIHEIKTPISLIKAPLHTIMTMDKPDMKKIHKELSVIDSSTEYMNTLVREMLDFISIEKHGYVLDIRSVDVLDVLKDILSGFMPAMSERGLNVNFIHSNVPVMIPADQKSLLKILNSLLDNALKYAQSKVEISLSESEESVSVVIRNDGPTIPQNIRKEIFKPFVKYDVHNSTVSQSFGIGLSLARQLMRMHGGELHLSDSDEYTEFVLKFLKNIPVPEESPEASVPEVHDTHLPTILLVEDNKSMMSYLNENFKSDYNVLSAASVEKALRLLGANRVDVVITDIGLIGRSGIELCRRIHEDSRYFDLPVIVLSAITSVETKVKCMEYGVAMYVEKPFTMDYLSACITNVLNKEKGKESSILEAVTSMKIRRMNVGRSDEEFLNRLDKFILDNIDNPDMDSEELEKAMSVSRSTLVRRLKGIVGMTPVEYLRKKRLSMAAKMLKSQNVRIEEVCYAVGFKYPNYFSKCFKEEFGVSPADYVKNNENR